MGKKYDAGRLVPNSGVLTRLSVLSSSRDRKQQMARTAWLMAATDMRPYGAQRVNKTDLPASA